MLGPFESGRVVLTPETTTVVWFKRDLRVEDHEPLVRAAERGCVIPLFVYEPELFRQPDFDPAHFEFQKQCLEELATRLRALGTPLVTRVGDVPSVLNELHGQHRFGHLASHQETGNATTYARDRRVLDWCRHKGVRWTESLQHGVFRRLPSRDGWAARWTKVMQRPILPAPRRIVSVQDLDSGNIRALRDFALPASEKTQAWRGGEEKANAVLTSFLEVRGERYPFEMSSPVTADAACSRLSPYLAHGAISMKTVLRATEARRRSLRGMKARGQDIGSDWLRSLQSFDKRLRWHCHFIQKLEDEPRIEFQNMARAYDGLREEDFDVEKFEAYKAGRTGYPMVDACMRCLHQTGWIGFRMRAMLMSFASYHLWLHWRPTALHLARLFVDYEPGIHFSQAQMQSGTTGINSLRIYSPKKQALDHDPEGRFIRRWLPELEKVPTAFLAEPHKLSRARQKELGCIIGRHYPAPIVNDHKSVQLARAKMLAVRSDARTKEEAQAVFRKHGSRRGPMRTRRL